MIAYYFRFIDEDGEPTGYTGMVAGKSKWHLFWGIDEFGDPYSVEILPVKAGGICYFENVERSPGGEVDVDRTQVELCLENPLYSDSEKWRKPNWEGVLSP